MARKSKTKKTVSHTVTLDARLWTAVDMLCDEFDTTRAVVVSKCLRSHLRRIAEDGQLDGVLKALGDHKPSPFEPFSEPAHQTIPQVPYQYPFVQETIIQPPNALSKFEIPGDFVLPAGGPPLETVSE